MGTANTKNKYSQETINRSKSGNIFKKLNILVRKIPVKVYKVDFPLNTTRFLLVS